MAFVGLRRAVRLGGAVERAPQIALLRPLHVVRDEQIELAVAIVIEPGGAGAEIRVLDAGCGGDVAELAAAFVVEQPVAFERGDVDVLAAVVVVVGDRHSHAVHLDIETAARRDIGKRAVRVVAVESRGGVAASRSPIFRVDQQDVEPAVAVGIEERTPEPMVSGRYFLPAFPRCA